MVLDLFKLDGRVALVTGSTRGIGQALQRLLWRKLAQQVIGLDRSDATADSRENFSRLADNSNRFTVIYSKRQRAIWKTSLSRQIHDEYGQC